MFDVTLICMGKLKEKFYIQAAQEYEKAAKLRDEEKELQQDKDTVLVLEQEAAKSSSEMYDSIQKAGKNSRSLYTRRFPSYR